MAGSDSGGGAGIQADLKTFAALGCYGTSAITAITAQNTLGVNAVQGIDPNVLEAQIKACWDDIPPRAFKSGMLYSKEIILALVRALQRNVQAEKAEHVLDPVMVSTSGHRLLSEDAIDMLKGDLLPLATIVTPNIPEAEILGGQTPGSIKTVDDMKACARAIARHGPEHVLIKGGHLPLSREAAGQGSGTKYIVDVLYDKARDSFRLFEKPAIDSKNTHGTGCTQSAALCAYLAQGSSAEDAVKAAGDYVRGAIAASWPLGGGAGPVHHLHTLVQRILPAPSSHKPHPFTDHLIAHTGPLWEQYVNHPFTVQLGKGTLPIKAFMHFIKQDYSFLMHYARVNALAAYKAKNFEDLSSSSFIIQTIMNEVKMHVRFCASQGVSQAELEATKESVTNIAYNRYVLDVSNAGDILDLRVATAPCLLGYGEVGLRLIGKPDDEVDRSSSNQYYEWALNYAKEDFQTAVRLGRDQLERMVADSPLSQKRLDELVKIFTQTTELEIAFWDTAMQAAESP